MTALDIPAIPHLLAVSDLDARQFDALLDLAATMKRHPLAWHSALEGRAIACLFAQPSTRTRVSFAAAIFRLGGLPIELELGRDDSIADTARVLSGYCDALVAGTFTRRDLALLAEHSAAPVIDANHPCQALADCFTLREHFGTLEGLRVAYVGDGNGAAQALIEAATRSGFELCICCPPGREADPATLMSAGCAVRVETDPRAAVREAHAVYGAPSLMALARHDAVFLAHEGEEVDPALSESHASLVWSQAANRLPTEQALLYTMVTGDWEA